MPEPLDPRRLAAERAWIAAYPALITSGLLASGLIALFSPLAVGPPRGLWMRVAVPALVLVASAGLARGRRWAGRVVLAWAALAMTLDFLVTRDFVMGCLGAVVLFVLYRVRPGAGAPSSPRALRWVVPAALVGVIDVVLPLTLGAVTPTRLADVAPIASTTGADLDLEHTWRGGAAVLTPRGGLLVLEGVAVAHGLEVAIDPGRRALLIGDAVLRGEPLAEPAAPGSGLAFVRRFGRVRGRVVLLRTAPDALELSFEGLEVDCRRVRAQVTLRRQPAPSASPEAPERE